jgi:hypothetical protein
VASRSLPRRIKIRWSVWTLRLIGQAFTTRENTTMSRQLLGRMASRTPVQSRMLGLREADRLPAGFVGVLGRELTCGQHVARCQTTRKRHAAFDTVNLRRLGEADTGKMG